MTYAVAGKIAGLGDAPCNSDFQAWKAAQLSCNAGNASGCAASALLPCVVNQGSCPPGQVWVYERVPKQAINGQWGTIAVSHCDPIASQAAITQVAKRHWGIYLGAIIAVAVVYKVATG